MYISVDKVSKSFNGKPVLQDISIDIEQGQMLALLGPSGCGKTTLLNTLSGLQDIDSGTITVGGIRYAERGYTLPAETRRVGMVFQDFALWPHMTVFDNIAFGLKVQKASTPHTHKRVRQVLRMVQMEEYAARFPHQLSGGQKQRVAIARALAPEPALLLMDEPLSNLDAKLRMEMRWQLTELIRSTGVTTVYVTHDQIEALTMADHIVLLNEGKVEQSGTPESLYASPKTAFAASFIGSANLFPCTIIRGQGNVASVDVGGFDTKATIFDDTLVNKAMWMVRPSDIDVMERPHSSDESGTAFDAVIEQRAFQGDTWQYMVRVIGNCDLRLELWNKRGYEVGRSLHLWIRHENARLVQPLESATVEAL